MKISQNFVAFSEYLNFTNSHKLFQNGSHDIGDTFASRSKIVTAWVQEKGHESGYFAKSGDLESQN